jgi:hypothetical protein
MKRIATLLLAVCVVTSSPVWAGQIKQLAQLALPGQANVFEGFGSAVAIAGTTTVVGAPSTGNVGTGYAYVYDEANGQNAVASFTDGTLRTHFGYSVAISDDGDTIVVGAPGSPELTGRGTVYVFVKPAGGWQSMPPTAALLVPNGHRSQGAGVAVSSDGSTVAVGAQGSNGNGRIYVFTRPSAGWQNTTVPAAILIGMGTGTFGGTVAMSGGTIVGGFLGVDAPGAAYVYVEPSSGWQNAQPTAMLTSSDGSAGDEFGSSVAITGNTVAVGAPRHANVGAAYVFVEPAAGWQDATQTAELGIQTQSTSDLGFSVSGGNNVVLAGDGKMTVGQNQGQGIVFVYLEPAGGWKDTSFPSVSITASDGLAGDDFGAAVAISSTTAVVGAPERTDHGRSGAGGAWVFDEQ